MNLSSIVSVWLLAETVALHCNESISSYGGLSVLALKKISSRGEINFGQLSVNTLVLQLLEKMSGKFFLPETLPCLMMIMTFFI